MKFHPHSEKLVWDQNSEKTKKKYGNFRLSYNAILINMNIRAQLKILRETHNNNKNNIIKENIINIYI